MNLLENYYPELKCRMIHYSTKKANNIKDVISKEYKAISWMQSSLKKAGSTNVLGASFAYHASENLPIWDYYKRHVFTGEDGTAEITKSREEIEEKYDDMTELYENFQKTESKMSV